MEQTDLKIVKVSEQRLSASHDMRQYTDSQTDSLKAVIGPVVDNFSNQVEGLS